MYSTDKDLNKEIKKLIKDGWTPWKNKGHWKITSKNGITLTISGTVSDFRTVIKFRSDVKRALRLERSQNER